MIRKWKRVTFLLYVAELKREMAGGGGVLILFVVIRLTCKQRELQ